MNKTENQLKLAHEFVDLMARAGFGRCPLEMRDIMSTLRSSPQLLRDFYLTFAGVSEVRCKRHLKSVHILCTEYPDFETVLKYRRDNHWCMTVVNDDAFSNVFEIGKLSILPMKLVKPVSVGEFLSSIGDLRLADFWQAEWLARHRECLSPSMIKVLKGGQWIIFGKEKCVSDSDQTSCYPCLTRSGSLDDIYVQRVREDEIINLKFHRFAYFKD